MIAPAHRAARRAGADRAGADGRGADGDGATDLVGRLSAYSALPGAERLLEAESLSALHGRGIVPRRLRVKPGASVLVGHCGARGRGRRPGPEGIAVAGWTLLTASATSATECCGAPPPARPSTSTSRRQGRSCSAAVSRQIP